MAWTRGEKMVAGASVATLVLFGGVGAALEENMKHLALILLFTGLGTGLVTLVGGMFLCQGSKPSSETAYTRVAISP